MTKTTGLALAAILATFAVPAMAQDAAPADKPMADHAMADKPMADKPMADHAMAKDDHMAMGKMSKADKRMMARCHKMSAAKAAKNAKCAAMMKKGDHMDHAM
jgi:hypothetical protein